MRRCALLAGSGANVARLCIAPSARRAAGSTTTSSARSRPTTDGVDLPVLGDVQDLPAILESEQVDELIVTDPDFRDRELLEIVEHAHRSGVQGADRAEDDRAA